MSRPKKYENRIPFSIRIPKECKEMIAAKAKKAHLSQAEYLITLIKGDKPGKPIVASMLTAMRQQLVNLENKYGEG
jgi:hypothetical protein